MGQELCQRVCNTLNKHVGLCLKEIWEQTVRVCPVLSYVCIQKHIQCHNKKENVLYNKEKSYSAGFLEEQRKKGIVLNSVLKYNALISFTVSLNQDQKKSSISELTHLLSHKDHMSNAIREIQAVYNKKKGAGSS